MESLTRVEGRGRINLVNTVPGKSLAGIGRNLYCPFFGLFWSWLVFRHVPWPLTYFPRSNTRKWCSHLVVTVPGKPLGGIGQNWYHALFGMFSGADYFFDALRDLWPTFQGQIHENGGAKHMNVHIYQALITVFHFCKDQLIVGLEGQALSTGDKVSVIITMELRRF